MKQFRLDKENKNLIKVLTEKFIAAIVVLMFASAVMYIGLGIITHL